MAESIEISRGWGSAKSPENSVEMQGGYIKESLWGNLIFFTFSPPRRQALPFQQQISFRCRFVEARLQNSDFMISLKFLGALPSLAVKILPKIDVFPCVALSVATQPASEIGAGELKSFSFSTENSGNFVKNFTIHLRESTGRGKVHARPTHLNYGQPFSKYRPHGLRF
ncbi:MAG: hypothetical protein HC767_07865 [Akkermansiaceae bacterium]|nr:hypothetical protein [Akkermansiaceae bacterium]